MPLKEDGAGASLDFRRVDGGLLVQTRDQGGAEFDLIAPIERPELDLVVLSDLPPAFKRFSVLNQLIQLGKLHALIIPVRLLGFPVFR